MFGTLMLMLKMKIFWLIFRGKFEQKTQKSICLQNQWKLKNINKAIVVKNMISNLKLFTTSISDQFWRSYQKVDFLHFLLFEFLAHIRNNVLELYRKAQQAHFGNTYISFAQKSFNEQLLSRRAGQPSASPPRCTRAPTSPPPPTPWCPSPPEQGGREEHNEVEEGMINEKATLMLVVDNDDIELDQYKYYHFEKERRPPSWVRGSGVYLQLGTTCVSSQWAAGPW